MVSKRKNWVFVDSAPFILDAAHEEDPRTPVTRRFLDVLRRSGTGITGAFNVLEFAGALSHRASPADVAGLVKQFSRIYGIKVWPDPHEGFVIQFQEVLDRVQRRMGAGDAIVLWLAETCVPAARTLVTWNVKDFAGKTRLEVKTPQQFYRGQ